MIIFQNNLTEKKPIYLITSYNTISGGTSNVSKNLLNYLISNRIDGKIYFILPSLNIFKDIAKNNKVISSLELIFFWHFRNIFNIFMRLFYDFIFFPIMVLKLRPKSILVLANYSPFKMAGKKIVFMRHPYLVDDYLLKKSDLKTRFIEKIKRFVFSRTINSADIIIVQTDYMKNMLFDKYELKNKDVVVLPNPISFLDNYNSEMFLDNSLKDDFNIILYVSRYYPHKNHNFIVKIVEKYAVQLRNSKIRFFVTLDPELHKNVKVLLDEIIKKKISDIIVNIGEIPQRELISYYKNAKLLFFPSNSETFGNPLAEAMFFGLPIIVPNLEYAKAICGDNCVFYNVNDVDDAYNKIRNIIDNSDVWSSFSQKSFKQSKNFFGMREWIEKIIELMN